MKRILILGASGTVGSAALKLLSQEKDLEISGTYFSTLQKEASSMIHFSVEFPNDIYSILEQARRISLFPACVETLINSWRFIEV